MNNDNAKKLLDRFTNLFNYYKDRFSFDCGDGWFNIVWKIMELVEEESKTIPTIKVSCVKEKFGSLRVYVDGTNETNWRSINEKITKIEQESMEICEECGKKGEYHSDLSWIRTLCSEHYFIELIKENSR